MAALHNLLAKIRAPGAAALRASPASAASSLPKGDLERALLLENNIESAKVADLRSSADLLAMHADQAGQAISQVIEKQEVLGRKFCTVAYTFLGSAVVLNCIDLMLDRYWKDKTDPELEFLVALALDDLE